MTPQMALIPDSVYGAVLLSVIDFSLSLLTISVVGFILALFPYLTALQATPVSVSVMPARDESAELAVVIAAAIYATLGVRRIVYVGEARPAPWTLEYRALVHTSHAPRVARR